MCFSVFKGKLKGSSNLEPSFIIRKYCSHENCKPVGSVLIEKQDIIDLHTILGAVERGRFHYKKYEELSFKLDRLRTVIESHIECKEEEK